jgi:tetratricopeptide (TPR) repeat protein
LSEDYTESVNKYRLILDWYSDYDKIDLVHFRLAELYYLHNNYAEALAEYNRIIDKFGDSKYKTASQFWAGVIYLLKRKYSKAVENFYAAQLSKEFRIQATLGLANSYYEMEDYSSSTNFYKKVITFDPKNTAAFLGIANCNFGTGNYDNAFKFYNIVLKEFPDSYESQIATSKVNFLKTHYASTNIEKPGAPEPYFTIQVMSVKDRRAANNLRINLKKLGLEPYVLQDSRDNLYKIRVGQYKAKADCNIDLQRLKENRYTPFVLSISE